MSTTEEKQCNKCKIHEGSCTRVKTIEDYRREQSAKALKSEEPSESMSPWDSWTTTGVWAPVDMLYPDHMGCKM